METAPSPPGGNGMKLPFLAARRRASGPSETAATPEADSGPAAKPSGRWRMPGRPALGRFVPTIVAACLVALVLVGSVFSGTVQATDVTLVIMGFDPDRSQLITSLMIGGVGAAITLLLTRSTVTATVLGAAAIGCLFGQTFVVESQNAQAAFGNLGHFDAIGWGLSLGTLLVAAVISAWAGAVLASAVRPALVATGSSIAQMIRRRRPDRRSIRLPATAALVLVLLALTVPAFGQMVNLTPDALMLGGGGNAATEPAASAASPSAKPSPTPTPELIYVPKDRATPSSTPAPHASPSTKP